MFDRHVFLSSTPPTTMSKRGEGSTRGGNPKVKKRKGVKIRTVAIPDSDGEDPPMNVCTDYARLVQTRVTASGKIGNVTTSSVPLLDEEEAAKDLPEVDTDRAGDPVVDNIITVIPTARKKRNKANDSVSFIELVLLSGLANGSLDQDAVLARRAVHRAR